MCASSYFNCWIVFFLLSLIAKIPSGKLWTNLKMNIYYEFYEYLHFIIKMYLLWKIEFAWVSSTRHWLLLRCNQFQINTVTYSLNIIQVEVKLSNKKSHGYALSLNRRWEVNERGRWENTVNEIYIFDLVNKFHHQNSN